MGHYKVIFSGLAVAGPEEETRLLKGLQKKFNLTPQRAESLLQRVPIIVKKGTSKEELEKYMRAFEAIGGKVRLEEDEEPLAESREAAYQAPQAAAPQAPQAPSQAAPHETPREESRATREAPRAPEPETKRYAGRMITCPQCGFEQPETDECLKCGIIISKYRKEKERERAQEGRVREGAREERTAWESGEGFITAFFKTTREVLFSSVRFFRGNATGEVFWSALIYGLIAGVVGWGGSFLWQWHFASRWVPMRMLPAIPYNFYLIITTILLPFLVVVSILIGTVVIHICLFIVGGNKSGFRTTFRVICYSFSGQLFMIIPFLGMAIANIYTPVLAILGIREGHGISTGRAVLAVFLPFILVAGFGILAAIFLPLFLGSKLFFGGVGV